MGMVHLDIKPENIFLSIPDSSNPVSPLSCIAEDSMKDEGPQPLYKIGRINMICCVLHVHVLCISVGWTTLVSNFVGGINCGWYHNAKTSHFRNACTHTHN